MDLIDERISQLIVEKSKNTTHIKVLMSDLSLAHSWSDSLNKRLSEWGKLKVQYMQLLDSKGESVRKND